MSAADSALHIKMKNLLRQRSLQKAIVPLIKGKKMDYTLILEPGRVLAGNAGILVTKVLYLKKSGRKNFVIVDAGMNDLIRPSLLQRVSQYNPCA